ncbi:GAF domain-containing protein [Dawidia soli]|uniref:GAF domain-containing protein n=1 Tax=Dawidia soli TaxID=2782352 RepID=A0AAP2DDL1_9BACT|nr:GAF domain-containing protein [Dawidia soli]MBT1688800.1 GAF domain-containing protein [Dawidia soli]
MKNYDSELCGSLPIHLTNHIQPYGVLLVIDRKSFNVIQASENSHLVFDEPVGEMIDAPLTRYISQGTVEKIQQKLTAAFANPLPDQWNIRGGEHFVLWHAKETYLIAEIEIPGFQTGEQSSFANVYHELKYAMSRIESADSITGLWQIVVAEIKKVSGFDKIMVYQFDEDWNGTVVAEVLEPGMEVYLGITFPASDIPRQARELYKRNPYRYIPDRDAQPVRLYPVINSLTGAFIDLFDCNLRSVATVHVEYLRNMGVSASMSIRIMKDNELWGLMACHHRTPRQLSFQMCSVLEMLSAAISAKLSLLVNKNNYQFDQSLKEKYTTLVKEIYASGNPDDTMVKTGRIAELFEADGLAIIRNGLTRTWGKTPSEEDLQELALWLSVQDIKGIYHTTSLSSVHDVAEHYRSTCSGLLCLLIDPRRHDFLLLFRPEVIETLQWGGNPDERIQFESDGKSYHPRNSFKIWQQTVTGRSAGWRREELLLAEVLRNFLYEFSTTRTK